MSGVLGVPTLGAGPARCMRDATELIARSLDDGAHAISNGVGGFAGELRNAGEGARNVDRIGADVINQTSNGSRSRGPWLIGWDASKRHYTFEPHQVRSNRLVNHEGTPFGVSFPTKNVMNQGISDEEAYSTWSRMPNRLSDTEYIPESRVTPTDGSAPGWKDNGPAQPAPWADDAKDGMLYVHAHAGPRGFEIEANVGTDDDPDWRTLLVPESSFGHVLAANEHFQAASRSGPGKPLLMLACGAGDPVHGHAERAAEILHRAGMNHDVYATVGINRVHWNTKEGTATVSVEVPDNAAPSDAITIIRAPNRPPAT